ncbi:hypothetical protein AX16_004995 [Volvariella volvacea WC 439]|nr:hypothetical protein AX16_004995 [Volvariella volvacea WC 439]
MLPSGPSPNFHTPILASERPPPHPVTVSCLSPLAPFTSLLARQRQNIIPTSDLNKKGIEAGTVRINSLESNEQLKATGVLSAVGGVAGIGLISLVHDIFQWQGGDRGTFQRFMCLGIASTACHAAALTLSSSSTGMANASAHPSRLSLLAYSIPNTIMVLQPSAYLLFLLALNDAIPLIFQDAAHIAILTVFTYFCLVVLIAQLLLRLLVEFGFKE